MRTRSSVRAGTRLNLFSLACVLIPIALPAIAAPSRGIPAPGDMYEIRRDYSTAEKNETDEGSSNSSGHSTVAERVIAVHFDGMELEYDLSSDAKPEDRLREWQLPARIFRPNRGTLRLLNAAALESRVDRLLKAGKMTRAACGRWIFTWNAFKIDCDPLSVLKTIAGYDMGWDKLAEGMPFNNKTAENPAPLVKRSTDTGGSTLAVEFTLNADYVCQQRAESDVIIGEIMRKPVTLEQALRERSREQISGRVSVIVSTNAAGREFKRVTTTSMRRQEVDGQIVTGTSTETLEKRLIAAAPRT